MPIPWESFESQLTSFFRGHRAKDEEEAADYLSDRYDMYAKQGRTQYQNGIATSNKEGLKNIFYIALLDARRGSSLQEVAQKISLGIVLYWRSVTMQTIVPPPGATVVVTNIVTVPGTLLSFPITNTPDPSLLAKAMIRNFKIHATTIQGINTALVPAPPGPPIPTPFPWVGIK